MPEGYRKVTEKTPVYNYVIPECARIVMEEHNGDQQVFCTELMDEILFDALEIHFLEPQVSFDIKTKIKPAISNQKKQDNPKDALPRYMQAKGEKPPVPPEQKVTAFAHMSAA